MTDGIFRIGRVTEIAPESVDRAYAAKIVNDGLDLAKYREVVRGDVIREKLEDKIVAEATKPGPQRDVAEIFLARRRRARPARRRQGAPHPLLARRTIQRPRRTGTSRRPIPSWAAAEAEAKATYDKLKADPTCSTRSRARRATRAARSAPNGSGGKLPGYVTQTAAYVESFKTADPRPEA